MALSLNDATRIFCVLICVLSVLALFSLRRSYQLKTEIVRRVEAEARVDHLTSHDTLTGLPNRQRFIRVLSGELAQAANHDTLVAVLSLELDGFKRAKESFGRGEADMILREVSARLAREVRNGDTVYHLAADSFAVVLVDLRDEAGAEAAARRIAASAGATIHLGRDVFRASASVGIAVADPTKEANLRPVELLRRADLALLSAKSSGPSTIRLFSPDMESEIAKRNALERDLRGAAARGELSVHFQPLVNLSENRVNGFEALLRWKHPTRGNVPPNVFIPVAEESELIVNIGEWVMEEACRTATSWNTPFNVAVNLSPRQFSDPRLCERVGEILRVTGLNPERLELEITENVLLEDTEHNLSTLRSLQSLGVTIALDDFGTGYASLGCLRRFPIDKIKIDQSFVRGMNENSSDWAIVQTMVSLGNSLGLLATAEGVETDVQLAHLRALGCTEAQGYFLARPMPADAIDAYLSEFCVSSEEQAADSVDSDEVIVIPLRASA